jgi:hypothetical protein
MPHSIHLLERIMSQRIRITTKADQFEKRKQEHRDAGYHIEDEHPVPVNGRCSFTAVRSIPNEDASR